MFFIDFLERGEIRELQIFMREKHLTSDSCTPTTGIEPVNLVICLDGELNYDFLDHRSMLNHLATQSGQ